MSDDGMIDEIIKGVNNMISEEVKEVMPHEAEIPAAKPAEATEPNVSEAPEEPAAPEPPVAPEPPEAPEPPAALEPPAAPEPPVAPEPPKPPASPDPEKDDRLVAMLEKTAVEMREIRKLYHNEFAGRLQNMQSELERYREVDKGRIFDPILMEIAKLYSDNHSVIERIEDEKVKKQVRYMFMDILQLLESNGVIKQESMEGEKRNNKYCQVLERIPTDDEAKHDTVAASRKIGFYVENRPLIKELVEVYVYEKPADNTADTNTVKEEESKDE